MGFQDRWRPTFPGGGSPASELVSFPVGGRLEAVKALYGRRARTTSPSIVASNIVADPFPARIEPLVDELKPGIPIAALVQRSWSISAGGTLQQTLNCHHMLG